MLGGIARRFCYYPSQLCFCPFDNLLAMKDNLSAVIVAMFCDIALSQSGGNASKLRPKTIQVDLWLISTSRAFVSISRRKLNESSFVYVRHCCWLAFYCARTKSAKSTDLHLFIHLPPPRISHWIYVLFPRLTTLKYL